MNKARSGGEPILPFLLEESVRTSTVDSLVPYVSAPFNEPTVMGNILLAAEQAYPYLPEYDTVVTEGDSARLSSYVFGAWLTSYAPNRVSAKLSCVL